MSGFYGADTEQLRGFGDLLGTATGRLSELSSQLAGQVNSVEWVGSDADAFRSDFSGRVNGLFDSAEGLLDRFRRETGDHADEQDEASDPSDGGVLGAIGDFLGGLWDGVTGVVGGVLDVINSGWFNGPLGILDGILDLSKVGQIVDAAGDLVNLTPAMRIFNGIAGPIGIISGINSMFNPEHEGWRGWGDRIAGGLSVASGIGGTIAAFGGAALLGPVLGPALAVAGIAAGAWTLGNLIYDNWDSITEFGGNVVDAVGDGISTVGNAIGDGVSAVGEGISIVGDAIGDVADGVGDFVGGLF
jgi:hypothetical protein